MNNCLFCKIANHELESDLILENDKAIAFLDKFPASYGHCLVIPKKHCNNLIECSLEDINAVMSLSQEVAKKLISADLGITGFNYLSNHNESAGQVIMHFHMHIIPKYDKDSGLKISNNNLKNDPTLKSKVESLINK